MTDISKAVSNSLKYITFDSRNNKRNMNKRPDNKVIFSFIITNPATNYEQKFIDSTLNYMVRYNMITSCPNSEGDSYFVNSEWVRCKMSGLLALKINATKTLKDYQILK